VNAAAARPAKAADRYRWMDLARGLAIILVIIVHAGSIWALNGFELPGWIRTIGVAMAPYRIPVLMFLSGILLDRSLKKGLGLFIYGKARNILWPFVVWTIIYCLAIGEPEKLLGTVWGGASYLWYMLFLGLYFTAAIFVARVPHWIVAFYAIALSAVLPDGTKYGERLFVLMGFFFFGAFVGQHLEKFTQALANRWTLALVPLAIGLSVASATVGALNYSPLYTIIILPSIAGICSLLYHFQDAALLRPLQFVGRRSVVYYVMHVPIYLVAMDLMVKGGVVAPYTVIFSCIVLGIAIPTLFARAMDRSRAVSLLFAAPDVVSFEQETRARRISDFLDRLKLLPARPAKAGPEQGRSPS
jgi:peptidoglycan/LPS O-acetylase OafA/YrhL